MNTVSFPFHLPYHPAARAEIQTACRRAGADEVWLVDTPAGGVIAFVGDVPHEAINETVSALCLPKRMD